MFHTYSFPTMIHAGPGVRQQLPDTIKAAGVRKPLIVTDKALADLFPVQDMRARLKAAGLDVQVYNGVWGNPVVSQVTAGVDVYKRGGRDGIVAVGGGAALDVAKCIALMAHHSGAILDYEDGTPGARAIDQPIPYIATVPTTAGTGSEVGRSAVVSDDDTHIKRIIFSPRLLAKSVYLDAELTLALPAPVTAATGLDALTHLIESYLALGNHPLCDGIALHGITLVRDSLEACVSFAQDKVGATPEHLRARDTMLHAAMMGAVAFQKGLGANHSCAHALSTVADLHHGLANGIMLPYVMAFNVAAVPDRFARMAVVAGCDAPTADAFIAWLRDLNRRIGIPAKLAAVGVQRAQLDALVDVAVQDGCHASNPRKVTGEDFAALFAQALA